MNHPLRILVTAFLAVACMATIPLGQHVAVAADANKDGTSQPDFTRGDAIPEGYVHDWNLGPTGLRGWIHSDRLETSDARQIKITQVEAGSPADGVLRVDDVILGVGDKPFGSDPRVAFGKAITAAETPTQDGKLNLLRWRAGQTDVVTVKLPVLGHYSETAPWDCPKSQQILDRGLTALAERVGDPSYRSVPITRSLNALALLAGGREDMLAQVKKEAQWAADFTTDGFKTWHYGYVITFLAEYVMATGDDSVLPGLRRLALESARGQSTVGSWGHRFVGSDGRLGGYGMMNSPGLPLTISLVLARRAGVDDPEVSEAIQKSSRLLRFYAGKGSIPYGDHHPWIQTHDDNGKNGMAAVLFRLLGEAETAEYFSRMSVACHGAERDCGHTGNFFNMVWAMPGVAESGPYATGSWMNEFGAWYFDLARRRDGTFLHQGPPQARNDSYRDWDCTGAWLLAYAIPNGNLHLTGKGDSSVRKIERAEAESLLDDGRGWSNNDRDRFYDSLDTEQLMSRLSSWSPTVRERAAIALGRRQDKVSDRLMELLESGELDARYGACQAIKWQRGRAAAAVPKLVAAFQSDDLWLRILAADALAGIGEPAKSAVPDMLRRLASNDLSNDPRNMQQRYLSFALFNQRDGLIGRSLEGIDRQLLIRAVRAGLTNEDGRARSSFSSVYTNLSFQEIQPLLPAIHQAIIEPAPSGIMFADGIQNSGLELLSKHRIDEGIELLADYARTQKQHGSQKRIIVVMKMLESYGAHAQRVIPQLEATANYFEHEEQDFPRNLSRDKARIVRETIQKIKLSTDRPELRSLNLAL
ncbi:DUF6288 domain-containing protein [Neorhodopirellula pilleata]|uniref:DUF6288 domain-containing protein n=1 Tax=Neorhodopirellula pilleata TaxID=2714738 RepID=UPI0011B4A6AA|nr:DUF6288 domain-containing protein [Neorhodopirellula pilleata]